MIRIQKLKQPKATSGKKISPGETVKLRGVEIKNKNKFDLYVDSWERRQKGVQDESR